MNAKYLVVTKLRGHIRKIVWDPRKPQPLDHPVHWIIERNASGVRIRNVRPVNEKPGKLLNPISLPDSSIDENKTFELPTATATGSPDQIKIQVRALTPIRPAFLVDDKASVGDKELCLYSGRKHHLFSYDRIGKRFKASVDNRKVFAIARSGIGDGYLIRAYEPGVCLVDLQNNKKFFDPIHAENVTAREIIHGTIRWKDYWFQIKGVGALGELAAVQSEDPGFHERVAFRKIAGHVSVFSFVIMLAMYLIPPDKEPRKISSTQVILKKPKVLALKKPLEEVKLTKRQSPPPQGTKSAKRLPGPKSAKRLPGPRKLARQKKPPVVVKKASPNPSIAAAKAAAKAKATAAAAQAKATAIARRAAQATLSRSLNFLSSAPKGVPSKAGNSAKAFFSTQAKYDTAMAVAPKTASLALKNVVGGVVSDANTFIETKGARNIGPVPISAGYGGGGKSFNDVQGRVSLATAFEAGGGAGEGFGSIGGAKGFSISGSGTISEQLLEKALAKHLDKFQYCYEKALLANASLAGHVMLQWIITTSGGALDAKVVKSQLNHAGLHSCIVRELARIKFPSPADGSVIIKYPFAFSSSMI